MISKISFLAAFVAIFSTTMGQEITVDYSPFEERIYKTEEDTLLYRLLVPQKINEGEHYPLVIFFHGSGERGNDNTITLKHIAPLFLDTANRKNYPAYVIVPQCPKELNWTYPDWYEEPQKPMSSVIKLIDQMITMDNIDSTRIYITGLSMGGYASWYLLTKFPKKFAAAIPISGGGDASRAAVFSQVPVWAFHGRKDDAVPVEQTRSMIKAMKAAGGHPKYTEYKKVKHNSWDFAYKEEKLLPWLFSQQLIKN